jgi:hypothetical protein
MTRAIRAALCAAGAHSSLQSLRLRLRVGTWRAVTPLRAVLACALSGREGNYVYVGKL